MNAVVVIAFYFYMMASYEHFCKHVENKKITFLFENRIFFLFKRVFVYQIRTKMHISKAFRAYTPGPFK